MTFGLPIVDQPTPPAEAACGASEGESPRGEAPEGASPEGEAPEGASFDDWRWQLRHRITGKQEIAARLPLTPEEEAGLEAAPRHFRVAITAYYFSLIY